MGIFNRISNMIKAKTNSALDEMENPVELLDQKIRDMEKSFNEAKRSSAQIFGNLKDTEKKMNEAKEESAQYDEKVRLAMSKGNEELAKKALKLKLDSDKKFESLKASYEGQRAKADVLKAKLVELEKELDKTRSYRDEAVARLNNAEASKQINEVIANVQSKSNSINIDDIERSISRKESYAAGLEELKGESLDDEFAKLEELSLDDELNKYRTQNTQEDRTSDSEVDLELEKYKNK
ncbi:PspA/IM30 family protein [Clostridium perfringens]|uniref:PspA/IM30 family protein n=1 Tax=Clostridium perfringens TaxID=1502 RepID=A0AAW9J345_CLOPF|nr:PspA/IM30 family protein [Clostridium perfringens]MBI5977343.1 PspA/IM30 family protein [Clostridium perfringens]MBI5978904.1 PspA/IM30 family protein [Clostridium perfringens]MBI5989912.1 PspA/IM30 family protein [Clostridium perfringens]MBI5998833.1 PspA/IM30 family protein [Clostridium perfringens]MBI6010445.1 PspA/IM30 family protein [Clostridium perfringens]